MRLLCRRYKGINGQSFPSPTELAQLRKRSRLTSNGSKGLKRLSSALMPMLLGKMPSMTLKGS